MMGYKLLQIVLFFSLLIIGCNGEITEPSDSDIEHDRDADLATDTEENREADGEEDRETDPVEACKKLSAQFGDDFPVPEPSETAQKKAPAIVSSSASA